MEIVQMVLCSQSCRTAGGTEGTGLGLFPSYEPMK